MATKLQELLEELKELKRYTNAIDIKGYSHFIEQGNGKIIMKTDLEELITKYTETTPTYKPGDSVRVIDCLKGHGFRIGEVVTLCNVNKNFFWKCANENDVWYMKEEEFEPIK